MKADLFEVGGVFTVTCYDAQGAVKWVEENHNTVVNVGKQHILDVVFASGSQVATWYLGLSSDSTAITATYSLAGEVGTRQSTAFTRTNQTVDSTEESFTGIDATVRKTFVVSASSGGTLVAVSDLSTARTLVNTDVLKVTYSISAT